MRDRLNEMLASIKALWTRATKKSRIIFLSSLVGVLLVTLVLVLILNHTNYVLLYNGLSTQESAGVLSVLSEMGVEPQITNAGAIYVPEQDLNRVRMQVATKGFTGGAFTYDVLKEAGMTATQADKNQWQVNQLQDRIQETIETFDEITQAVVTISMPQPSLYTLQNDTLPPSASVKITKRQGKQLSEEQIQGIINIVKDSVAGLTEENISISDETGDIKSLLESYRGSSASKLNLTEQVGNSVRSNIMAMLQPVFGADSVKVAVYPVLDTNAQVTESTDYVPFDEENPQNNPLDYAEYEREKLGGEAGPAQGVPGANDNVDVPQYTARDVDVEDADSYAVRDVYDYLVSSIKNQIIKEGFEITDMTAAVVVDYNSLTDSQKSQQIEQDELKAQVTDIVARAAGIQGDNVSVQIMQFARAAVAVGLLKGKSYLSIGAVSMGIMGSYPDMAFYQKYLGMRVEFCDMSEIERRVSQGIYD
ncbi:MAG: flagellar M-ring protein FliF, partial [Oscillospiraceae bacterium]|nr:flagellar M-ring protein FliF [Oscillospiraceae bacterium]